MRTSPDDETLVARWLKSLTGQSSLRGVARVVGVSHTTVRRWVLHGVPPQTASDLVLRFQGDLIAALVAQGRITQDQVPEINYAAIARYTPAEVMTAEIHRRTLLAVGDSPDVDPRQVRVEW